MSSLDYADDIFRLDYPADDYLAEYAAPLYGVASSHVIDRGATSAGATPSSAAHATPCNQPPLVPAMLQQKLTPEQAIEIFRMKKHKTSQTAAIQARIYGTTAKAIRDIWTCRTWTLFTKPFWGREDYCAAQHTSRKRHKPVCHPRVSSTHSSESDELSPPKQHRFDGQAGFSYSELGDAGASHFMKALALARSIKARRAQLAELFPACDHDDEGHPTRRADVMHIHRDGNHAFAGAERKNATATTFASLAPSVDGFGNMVRDHATFGRHTYQ